MASPFDMKKIKKNLRGEHSWRVLNPGMYVRVRKDIPPDELATMDAKGNPINNRMRYDRMGFLQHRGKLVKITSLHRGSAGYYFWKVATDGGKEDVSAQFVPQWFEKLAENDLFDLIRRGMIVKVRTDLDLTYGVFGEYINAFGHLKPLYVDKEIKKFRGKSVEISEMSVAGWWKISGSRLSFAPRWFDPAELDKATYTLEYAVSPFDMKKIKKNLRYKNARRKSVWGMDDEELEEFVLGKYIEDIEFDWMDVYPVLDKGNIIVDIYYTDNPETFKGINKDKIYYDSDSDVYRYSDVYKAYAMEAFEFCMDSKFKDVFYHGSKVPIKIFDREKGISLTSGRFEGFHFGTLKQAEFRNDAFTTKVNLCIKNPIRMKDSDDGKWYLKIRKAINKGYDGIVYLNRFEAIPSWEFEAAKKRGIKTGVTALNKMTDEQFKNNFPSAADSYIAFSPAQMNILNSEYSGSSFSPHLFSKKAYSASPFNMTKIRAALSSRRISLEDIICPSCGERSLFFRRFDDADETHSLDSNDIITKGEWVCSKCTQKMDWGYEGNHFKTLNDREINYIYEDSFDFKHKPSRPTYHGINGPILFEERFEKPGGKRYSIVVVWFDHDRSNYGIQKIWGNIDVEGSFAGTTSNFLKRGKKFSDSTRYRLKLRELGGYMGGFYGDWEGVMNDLEWFYTDLEMRGEGHESVNYFISDLVKGHMKKSLKEAMRMCKDGHTSKISGMDYNSL